MCALPTRLASLYAAILHMLAACSPALLHASSGALSGNLEMNNCGAINTSVREILCDWSRNLKHLINLSSSPLLLLYDAAQFVIIGRASTTKLFRRICIGCKSSFCPTTPQVQLGWAWSLIASLKSKYGIEIPSTSKA